MLNMPSSLKLWRLDHPVWLCPFRPFFGLALIYAPLLMLSWLLVLIGLLPPPQVPGGPVVWHVHELLLGVSLAAVVGFLLTAVPEFTRSPGIAPALVRRLVLAWLVGRLGFWATIGWPSQGLVLAFLAHLVLLGDLLWTIGRPIWHAPGRRHLGFVWGVLALYLAMAGFYIDAQRDLDVMHWLHTQLGVLLILIIVSMSRISMAIVNDAIDDYRLRHPDWQREEEVPGSYLARPPRRHLAVFCITLFTVTQWFGPAHPVNGWLALAAAAAMLNLLNDWHVGRPLLQRWPLMLYGVYVLMALGYGLIGISLLADQGGASAGLHLLASGALSLALYVVIAIAGYTHSGLSKDGRDWIGVGAVLIVAGALLRALVYWMPEAIWMLGLSALLWTTAFVVQAAAMLPVFLRARADGRDGCAGVLPQDFRPSDSGR